MSRADLLRKSAFKCYHSRMRTRHLTLLSLALFTLAAVGCATKTEEAEDTGPDVFEFEECTPTSGDWPMASGTYTVSTDAALYNGCENEVGNGYHIHVGEENPFAITADENCINADGEGMLLAGEIVDNRLEMIGYIDIEHGICTMRIDATFSATITGENSFDYQIDAVAAPVNDTDEYCEMMIGESEGATFPEIPCSYGWTGRGWLE